MTPLSGSIAPGGYYLVQEAAGTGGSADLPTPDATGAVNLSGTSGTVALVTSQTALGCKTAADCAADTAVRDLVGHGTAVVHEGTADAPTLGNSSADTRDTSGADTDQNGTLPLDQQYTDDYEGVSEVLDHILVSRGVGESTYQVVHMNSEYTSQTSDHDPQEVQFRP